MKEEIYKRKHTGKNPETYIQNAVRDFLVLNGWYVIRNQQSIASHKGMSDLTCVKNGIVVFVEVKTETGRLSEHQKGFCKEIAGHGGIFEVARSLDDAIKINRLYGNSRMSLEPVGEE